MDNSIPLHPNIKMKHLCLIFIFFVFFASSQDIKTKLIKHSWANGCYNCSHGCNYTLTIIPEKEIISGITVKSICVDAHYFGVSKLKIKTNKNNTITLYFGWTHESEKVESDPEKNANKSNQITNWCNEEGLALLINGQKKKIKFSEIKVIPAEPRP